MTYCRIVNVQVLQEASQWCPDAEKVFVSPTGQLVDPAAAQQQVAAPHANGASQPQAPGKAVPEHTRICLINYPAHHDLFSDHVRKMRSLDDKAQERVHHQLCCAAAVNWSSLDRPTAHPDGCQHRLQILLRLRPYPMRGHRLL